MLTNDDEDIRRLLGLLKRIYPRIIALAREKTCPSEDILAAFAEGKLKEKREEQVISHLVICGDCFETIRFLHQKPSAERVTVPLWLEKSVCDLFPEKPKTWEIVVGGPKAVVAVITHTAEECWSIPGLEVVPARIDLKHDSLYSPQLVSPRRESYRRPETLVEFRKTEQKPRGKPLKESKEALSKEVLTLADSKVSRSVRLPVPIPTAEDKMLKSLSRKISKGFVFLEHVGPFKVYLVVAKKEGKQLEMFDVEIDAYDRSGEFAGDMEVSFVQGGKTIDKLRTEREGGLSKRLAPQEYSINFGYKGISLGQAILNLRDK